MCLMIDSTFDVPSLLPDYIINTTNYSTSSENWERRKHGRQCGLSGIVLNTQLTCVLWNRVGPKKEKIKVYYLVGSTLGWCLHVFLFC